MDTQPNPKPDPLDAQDETSCEVCQSDQYADDDLIIFCDGCNLAVHQVSYEPLSHMLTRACV